MRGDHLLLRLRSGMSQAYQLNKFIEAQAESLSHTDLLDRYRRLTLETCGQVDSGMCEEADDLGGLGHIWPLA